MTYLPSALAVFAAYLIGSLSFAVIVSRLMGLADPRSYGSGNPGATNVLRKGGKGVATAAGVLMALNPWLGVATLASWVLIAAFFRYSSLASIVAALFAPFYQLLIWGVDASALPIAIMSLLLVWRHEGNIRKLLAGTESRLGQKSSAMGTSGSLAGASATHGHGRGHSHGHGHGHGQGRNKGHK
jgi:acyl phosphate:glycerol-3-phosphate acyltransferase